MTRRFVLSYVRTCPHSGKRTYATKRAAKRVARMMGDSRLVPYQCEHCWGGWHLGHLPGPVVRGTSPRSGITDGGAA